MYGALISPACVPPDLSRTNRVLALFCDNILCCRKEPLLCCVLVLGAGMQKVKV